MFLLSKLIWIFLSPLNLLLIILLLGFLLKIIKKNSFSKFFYIIGLFFFTFVGIFPTGNYLLFKLESKYPSLIDIPQNIDGILILGGPSSPNLTNIHNQVSFNEAGERLTEAVKLIKKYKNAKIVFAGGSGSLNINALPHTFVARKFFSEMDINTNNILFESESKNTYENILFSKKIVKPKTNEKWLLITSSFHMCRAMNVAEKLNWKFIPYSVDFRTNKTKFTYLPTFDKTLKNFNSFNLASHEIVGLISYYFLGRTSKIF